MEEFGHFGKNSQSYSEGRRGYPEVVFYYLKVFANEEDTILDIGCGTGISTRQLVLNGFENVQGLDHDPDMLDLAREHATFKYIPYWLEEVANTSFRTQFFHIITCFSSFHWFTDEESMAEIRRILKPSGLLFIVRKEDITPFKDEVKNAIEAKLNLTFPSLFSQQEIESTLRSHRFKLETPKAFEGEDLYSLAEAILYIKSTSYWAAIDDSRKDELLHTVVTPLLEKHIEISKREKGRIIRRYHAICLAAHKI